MEDEISVEELEVIIEEAPKSKAVGPSEISNEMIKKLGKKARMLMLRIMNACLKFQMVPKNWKKGNVYPIAKTEEFTGELD